MQEGLINQNSATSAMSQVIIQTPPRALRPKEAILSPAKPILRELKIVNTMAMKTYIVLKQEDPGPAVAYLQKAVNGKRDWVGRMVGAPIIQIWKGSSTCWEYVGDDVPREDMLEFLQSLTEEGELFEDYKVMTVHPTVVPEMLMHSQVSLIKALHKMCAQHSCSPEKLSDHTNLKNWFGETSNCDSVIADLLGCKKRKAESAASKAASWKARKQSRIGSGVGSSGSGTSNN